MTWRTGEEPLLCSSWARISRARWTTGCGTPASPRDFDAVAPVGRSGDQAAEEDDFPVPFPDGDVHGVYTGDLAFQCREFVVMRGKEGSDAAPGPPCQLFRNGPRQSQPVERARAASDFVKDDEAALGGLTQDARGLHHLHHERTLALSQIVRSAHAGEDAIAQAKLRFPGPGQKSPSARGGRSARSGGARSTYQPCWGR